MAKFLKEVVVETVEPLSVIYYKSLQTSVCSWIEVPFHHPIIYTKHKTLALGALRAPSAKVLCFVVAL